MPDPIDGLVVVAEFGTKFDADAAVGLLQSHGIAAVPSYDPALNSVAPHWASDRVVEVLVHAERHDEALEILGQTGSSLPQDFLEDWQPVTRGRRRAVRLSRGCVIWGSSAVILVILVALVVAAIT